MGLFGRFVVVVFVGVLLSVIREGEGALLDYDGIHPATLNSTLFLAFFDPLCQRCKGEMKGFEEASSSLPSVSFLRIDTHLNSDLTKAFNVSGAISFKLIKEGLVYTFHGPKTKDFMIPFIQFPEGPSAPLPPIFRQVVVLTDDTFNNFLPHGDWFLFVYVPWSGTCRRMEPQLADLARSMDIPSSLLIAKISLLTEIEFLHQYGIDRINQKFPLLYRIHHGKYFVYDWTDDLVSFRSTLSHPDDLPYTMKPLPPPLGMMSHLSYFAEDYFHGPTPFIVVTFIVIFSLYIYFVYKYLVKPAADVKVVPIGGKKV